MELLVPITLYGWIIVAIGLFFFLTPRRAVLVAFILAWLFLPQAGIPILGFPDLDKITATSFGALIGVIVFDAGRLARFRFHRVDLPMVVWTLCNIPSSLTNDLGWYDGLSGVNRDLWTWGVPYLIGRLYFNDLAALRELAIGIFLGGLIYVPLCLFELKMSPQLHHMVYGFSTSSILMEMRYGGYRPKVFMQHGLMLGMWMTSASLVGVWLWQTGALRRVLNVPMWVLVPLLFGVSVMCKSTGAIALLLLGLGILFVNKYVRSGVLLAVLLSITPLYMLLRTQGLWSGKDMVEISKMLSAERADSLDGRLDNEDLIIERASKKPIFGWGGWGRWRVHDEKTGQDITISDGWWVIARGERGLVGLTAMTSILLLPFALLMRRVPSKYWSHAVFAAPATLAMLLMLYSVDNLFNAMLNPIFLLGAGGLSGLFVAHRSAMSMVRHAQVEALRQVYRRASDSRLEALAAAQG